MDKGEMMKNLFLLSMSMYFCLAAFPAEPVITGDNWELFRDVYSLVLDTYVEPKSPDQLLTGALEGLAAATGPECGYIPGSRLAETEAAEKSGFYLPLYITKNGGFAGVIAPFAGEDPEIEPGDLLRFVNGRSVFDMNFPQLVAAMKGAESHEVTCGFMKKDSFKPYEKKLSMKKPADPVFRNIGEKCSVLEIPCLEADIGQGLKEKLAVARSRMILDLRGCASADESRALVIAGMLFGKGSLKFAGKNGTADIPFSGEGLIGNRKVVVLVDGTTARGGEVLALAGSKNGTLAGAETYGFCALHEKVMLKNGDALVVLTGYFLDREGREIKDNPLKPDRALDVSDRGRKDDFYLKVLAEESKKDKNDTAR